jgi:hypothetical protein
MKNIFLLSLALFAHLLNAQIKKDTVYTNDAVITTEVYHGVMVRAFEKKTNEDLNGWDVFNQNNGDIEAIKYEDNEMKEVVLKSKDGLLKVRFLPCHLFDKCTKCFIYDEDGKLKQKYYVENGELLSNKNARKHGLYHEYNNKGAMTAKQFYYHGKLQADMDVSTPEKARGINVIKTYFMPKKSTNL